MEEIRRFILEERGRGVTLMGFWHSTHWEGKGHGSDSFGCLVHRAHRGMDMIGTTFGALGEDGGGRDSGGLVHSVVAWLDPGGFSGHRAEGTATLGTFGAWSF